MKQPQPIKALSMLDLIPDGECYTFVVFNNGGNDRWYEWLAMDGFKHCFVVHFDGNAWTRIEKTYNHLEVEPLIVVDSFVVGRMNLKRYYEAKGFTTQVVKLSRCTDNMRVKLIFAPNTCVETVKDFIGLSSYRIFSPYQLYKRLREDNGRI